MVHIVMRMPTVPISMALTGVFVKKVTQAMEKSVKMLMNALITAGIVVTVKQHAITVMGPSPAHVTMVLLVLDTSALVRIVN